MATRTSVGSGLWSVAGTWDTGVPADGDVVVIAAGHVVEFDVDQSGFANGINGLTITGTLKLTRTTGVYYLKMKAATTIGGAGTFDCGASGDAIPFAAKHEITGGAAWYIQGSGGLTMTVYAAEPTNKTIYLSGGEAIGQTELSVDTNVTGDIWAAGDLVRIDDINQGSESEERTIAVGGIASGAITVTAGLTAAKSTGAYVSLISRNVKFIGVGASGYVAQNFASGKLTIAGGEWKTANYRVFNVCNDITISGGTFSGNNNVVISCTSAIISGGTFSGNNNGVSNCTSPIISGGTFSGNSYGVSACTSAIISGGTFSGNSYVVNGCTSPIISGGTFSGNSYGVSACTSAIISGGTFTSNAYNLRRIDGVLYNITLTSGTEHHEYTSMYPTVTGCQSFNHDGADGALKAWCKGGVVTSQTSVKPDGYTQAYLLDPESATYPVFFYKTFSVKPGKTVNIEVQLRKDASMTYLPRVYLMASIGNPLAGATPVDTFTMSDSTDTWETDTFSITNSTDYDQDYTLWFVAKNASGNAYSAYDITTEGGGTSSVKIMPLGRVGL